MERYGDELRALVEDSGADGAMVVDLFAGAARQWIRGPRACAAGGEPARRRVQASVSMVWVAWCAGFLVSAAVNRWLLDPRPAHVATGVAGLLAVAGWAAAAGCVVAFVAALPILASVVRASRRSRDQGRGWAVWRPLVLLAVLLGLDVSGAGVLALWRTAYPAQPPAEAFPAGFGAATLAWAVSMLATLIVAGLAPVEVIRRARPDARALRPAGYLALPLGILLAVTAAATAGAVVLLAVSGEFGAFDVTVAALVVGVAAGAAAVALASASRGMPSVARPAA